MTSRYFFLCFFLLFSQTKCFTQQNSFEKSKFSILGNNSQEIFISNISTNKSFNPKNVSDQGLSESLILLQPTLKSASIYFSTGKSYFQIKDSTIDSKNFKRLNNDTIQNFSLSNTELINSGAIDFTKIEKLIFLNIKSIYLVFSRSQFKYLTIVNSSSNLTITACDIDSLILRLCSLNNFSINSCQIKNIHLQNIAFSGFNFNLNNLPQSIFLDNIFCDSSSILDFTTFVPTDFTCKLIIGNIQPEKIKLNGVNFEISFLPNLTSDQKIYTLKYLRDKQKEWNYLDGYKALDIQYENLVASLSKSSFTKFTNWLNAYWSNYGYNKELIFKHTMEYVLFLTLITFLFLRYLNEKVYKHENIPTNIPHLVNIYKNENRYEYTTASLKQIIINIFERLWFSFIYTFTIFFRLTLKVEKINFRRFWGAFYLMIIYCLGIICLAFIVNFIFQK